MPAPSRDRLARPVDISTLFRGAARRVDLIVDEPGLRWSGLSENSNPNQSVSSSVGGRRSPLSTRRVSGHGIGYGRNRRPVGRENRMVARRGGGRGSVLPSWYPRTPLRDITAIVRAIERRRAEIHHDEAVEAPQEETTAPTPSSAQLEHEIGPSTPMPTITFKPQPSPATQVLKIMADIPDKDADLDGLTPQKRLLHSIDKVREVWLEERRKIERTPAARKEERAKKVRTLMSMR